MSKISKRIYRLSNKHLLRRRDFILSSLLFSIGGKIVFSENREDKKYGWNTYLNYESFNDEKTGATIYRLITGPSKNSTIYQTHPMWGINNKHFYFYSDRTNGKMQLHRLDIASKEIIPVFENNVDDFCLTWKSEQIFFIKEHKVVKQDVLGKQTEVGFIPESFGGAIGGTAVSSDDGWFYCGTYKDGEEHRILRRLKLQDGTWEECVRVPFTIGHIQTNYWNPELIMFCWETGGDSPQRTWCWSEKTKEAEPFFVEHDDLWVTHEVWWGANRALFTIWPYDEKHKKLPHGVAETNKKKGAKGKMNVLATYPAWHTHGSRDYQWVLGDDFERNIWLISPQKKERRLLVTGKISNDLKVHPHASFLPDSSGIVFNSSRFGYEEIHLVLLPEKYDSLPLAKNEVYD
ncbi:MAG: hypothetical protein LDL53_07445 [Candidatus Hydrogenedens sp.]|nr:hypothetical protein [Candidatus Hydrogenedens sp.]